MHLVQIQAGFAGFIRKPMDVWRVQTMLWTSAVRPAIFAQCPLLVRKLLTCVSNNNFKLWVGQGRWGGYRFFSWLYEVAWELHDQKMRPPPPLQNSTSNIEHNTDPVSLPGQSPVKWSKQQSTLVRSRIAVITKSRLVIQGSYRFLDLKFKTFSGLFSKTIISFSRLKVIK